MALPENVKWDDSARHERFREQVTALRRQAGRQQQELAAALGLAPHVLSRKLRGLDGARLTHPEVKAIVRTLVAWDALGSQEEALTLLALAGASPASISEEEWARPPLNRLPRVGLRPAASAGLSPVPSLPALPVPPTRLIGRDALRQRVSERLRDPQIRLLTLFGPGGVGKTRLSLAVARTMVPDFPEGIYFVPLGSLHDPSAVPGALVQALALRSTGAGWNTLPDHELIGTALAGKRLLLVLDNFEHLLPAALFLAELLAAAPGPKLLVTSRAVLRLAGESILDVPPLVRPAPPYMTDPAAVAGYPAVQLFLERARACYAL